MISIHRVVLRRLLLAWLLVSLLVGGGTWYVEMENIDDAVVALAASEARNFSSVELDVGHRTPEQVSRLAAQAKEFVQRNFVVIEVYDQAENKIVEAVNPRFEHVEKVLATHTHAFPRDTRSHYEKFTIDGLTVVQVLVPLPGAKGGTVGYFEGVFVVDQATIEQFDAQLRHTLFGALLAALLTTLILYPVIIALNKDVLRYSREVLQGNLDMASVLGSAIAKRDSDTGEHNYRVTLYAVALAERAGQPAESIRGLIIGAFLHDVGKIGISDNILLKPGKLTEEEFAIMRTHVALGVDIVAQSAWLAPAREVIEYHHEKYNGTGYLQGLQGEAIPVNARIFAIVDVFDALTARRPYKEPFPLERALAMIEQDAGSHFDPALVAHFLAIAPALYAAIGHASEAELQAKQQAQSLRYFLHLSA